MMPRRRKHERRREKYTKAKKEAVAKVKKDERKAKPKVQKVTRLYKPALSAGKAPKQAK